MRGLLMIETLYHQTIAGKKTMTRRSGGLEAVNKNPDAWEAGATITSPNLNLDLLDGPNVLGKEFVPRGAGILQVVSAGNLTCKPRYKVGEVLYLKEPVGIKFTLNPREICYKYNYTEDERSALKWTNKLFMPATAARAFIRITGIKCERLLDISDEDCIAEGIENNGKIAGVIAWKNYQSKNGLTFYEQPVNSFASLYKFANKMKPAAKISNLWVWAYTFEYLPNYKLNA